MFQENLFGNELPTPDSFTARNLAFFALILIDEARKDPEREAGSIEKAVPDDEEDLNGLAVTYSLETGMVTWQSAQGRREISLRDNSQFPELEELWEPMTPERFTYLIARLNPTLATGIYRPCALSISPDGQVIYLHTYPPSKDPAGSRERPADSEPNIFLKATTIELFRHEIFIEGTGISRWQDWADSRDWIRSQRREHGGPLPEPLSAQYREALRHEGYVEHMGNPRTLAEFAARAAYAHDIEGSYVETEEFAPETIEFLRENLGVDLKTSINWGAANSARIDNRLNAETATFPSEQNKQATRLLGAAIRQQFARRPQPRTTPTITPGPPTTPTRRPHPPRAT